MLALVTGGAGFIGSHLAELLIERGWRVLAMDDLSTGVEANLGALSRAPEFDLVRGSVADEAAVTRAARHASCIFHLASVVGAALVVERPEQTIQTAVRGTGLVLQAAALRRTPTFVASTSEVYGRSPQQPLHEDQPLVIAPSSSLRSGYALGKAAAEVMVGSYCRDNRVPAVVGRLFNTIGPRQRSSYGMVVPSFAGRALAGQPLVIHGDGTQRRCFTYVGDAVRAVTALMDTPDTVGRIVNIGSTHETTVAELADLVLELTGSRSEVSFVPYESVHGPGTRDVGRRVPDTTRLHALTGLRCSTPLRDSVCRVIESLRAEPAPVLDTRKESGDSSLAL
jgi:UDP-glucose 4-epimerase